MAWQRVGRGAKLFVSGESHALPLADARRIAGNERLDGGEYAKLSITGRDLVQALLQDGHYALEQPGDDVA
jgi:50S ribosomal protein L16 3-hydroxylase